MTETNETGHEDAIELRGRRKSELREAFRSIQHDPERGPGTVVAFANWHDAHPHVDATLRGLIETNSITEPVRDNRGRAVVRILGENEDWRSSDVVDLTQVSIDKEAAAVFTEEVPQSAPSPSAQDRPEPPPQSGQGSGVENWREYAAATTGTPASDWADKSRSEIIDDLASRNIAV